MALSNTNLSARWLINEASGGDTSTTPAADDFSTQDLALTFWSGQFSWIDGGGSPDIHLYSTSATSTNGNGEYVLASGKPIYDDLNGSTTITFEILCNVVTGNSSTGRIMAINDNAGNNPTFGFACDTSDFLFYWEGSVTDKWSLSGNTGWNVYHAVINTAEAANDRVKIYKNGSILSTTNVTAPGDTDGLSLNTTSHRVYLMNRYNGTGWNRSIVGGVAYAALYNETFSTGRITDHNTELASNDDSPAVGGAIVFPAELFNPAKRPLYKR